MPFPAGYAVGFPYPPPIFLLIIPVAHLPFELGFFVWSALLAGTAVLVLRWARLPWPVIAAGLLSPAALWNDQLGQFGTVGGALLVAGLLLAQTAPGRAGALLGLLVIKPQIGMLVPALWLGRGGARLALGFFVVVLGAVGLTLVIFGPHLWGAFFFQGSRGEVSLMAGHIAAGMAQSTGVTVFWMMRSLKIGTGLAAAIQVVCSLAAFGMCVRLWGRNGMDPIRRMALTTMLFLIAMPYGYTDDMVAFSLALAALAARRGWGLGVIDVLGWLWPAFCQPVVGITGVLFTPLVVGLALGREIWLERSA
nr:glycosyltransferase family 87 protein [Acidocella sp.]